MKRTSRALCLAILASASPLAIAQAQTTAAPAAPEESMALEELVVTARKTNENLMDVPLAITALNAQALKARGIDDILDLAAFTPGFRFQNQAVGRNDRGFKQFVIRGMVPNTAIANRQSVTIFVDGAPISGGNIAGVTDIEQVEVVRGPQSALFGRSTFAGAVNFKTAAPSYTWGGNVDMSYKRFNDHDLTATVEGPIIEEKLAFRLSARDYSTDGPYKDVNYPGERLGARSTDSISLALRANPTDTLEIRAFGVVWKDSDGLPANAQYNAANYNCNSGVASLGTNYICGKLSTPPTATRSWNQNIEPVPYARVQNGLNLFGAGFIDHLGLEREAQQYRTNFDWRLGEYTLSGIASYNKEKWAFLQTPFGLDVRSIPNINFGTTAGTAAGVLPYVYGLTMGDNANEDKYGELRLASPKDKPLHGLIGVTYLDSQTDLTTSSFAGVGYTVNSAHSIYKTQTAGVFASATYDVSEKLSLTGEGRYQDDKESQQIINAAALPTFSRTYTSFTPRAIASYKPTEDSSVYASYSIGNRPGEFNAQYYSATPFVQAQVTTAANVQGSVPEDKVKMTEIGYKAQLFDHRLRVLASAYVGKWTNRHVQNNINIFLTPTAQAANVPSQFAIVAPNGAVDLKGFELETAFRATSKLTLEGTFSMADTKIKTTSCSDCLALAGNANPVGNQLPFYPKYSGSASATYETQIGEYMASFRADALYTGKQYETEQNLAWTAPATLINLRAGVEKDGYRFELFGTNVFNNKAPTSLARGTYAAYNANGTSTTRNSITVSLPDPAIYGVRFSKRFN
ncbi:hypothetical protein BH10PSE4_BH10PSE4_46120 [soil metagenome]